MLGGGGAGGKAGFKPKYNQNLKWATTKHDMHISIQTEGPITGDWEGGGGRRKISVHK